MTEVKELNDTTISLLEKTNELKKDIKNSMTHGEVNIIRGIIIFETILKEINPKEIDENGIDYIEAYVRKYLSKKEEIAQKYNPYVHYGVNRCFLILETTYRVNTLEPDTTKTKKIWKK